MPDIESLQRNTEHFISPDELRARLQSKKSLRVKLGVDPTRPDLTFGHMVVFNKLRQFQDLGHQAVLIIGDYTAMIGDPSGRSSTRPVLSEAEVKTNATTYLDQAFKILDRAKTEVRFNSEWFAKMSLGDLLNLSRKMTVAQMLERDDFSKRYAGNAPISIVEFLYPLIQGHDSVMIKSDVELGGSDQLFNNLVGRVLQKDAGQPEQIVICSPLLVGLDGVKKMSKSQDNYIAFNDTPKEMFGKIMSISDKVMWDYYRLLLEESEAAIAERKAGHPMAAKKNLARTLVSKFHGADAGKHELEQFEKVFARHEIPDDMPTFKWGALASGADATIVDLLAATKLFASKNEVK
ncbi:MAG TPA: tyrosine--tRNA ligase, partial [Opitutales bacterium]|nr:tyrosine--tRNA ligase [Opitutales bacterium]